MTCTFKTIADTTTGGGCARTIYVDRSPNMHTPSLSTALLALGEVAVPAEPAAAGGALVVRDEGREATLSDAREETNSVAEGEDEWSAGTWVQCDVCTKVCCAPACAYARAADQQASRARRCPSRESFLESLGTDNATAIENMKKIQPHFKKILDNIDEYLKSKKIEDK